MIKDIKTIDNIRVNDYRDFESILDKHIFKYLPLKYLLVLLKEKKLIMNRVSTWEDPYENFIFKEDYKLSNGIGLGLQDIQNDLFGLSWTLRRETDAMWRIYSPDKLSIRIETTPRKLLYATGNNSSDWVSVLGRVKYPYKKDIDKWITSLGQSSSFFDLAEHKVPESFFIKRKAFAHEEEFRVIVYQPMNDNASEETKNRLGICFNIEPSEFLNKYYLDPRLDENMYKAIRSSLISFGVNQNKIHQSPLYSFRKRTINLQFSDI